MEKRIELEKRNRSLDQIDELNLDNCRSTTIEGLSDEFVNLRALSLNGVGLTSLKGFPTLSNLRKLEMGDNRIAGGLQVLKDCSRLAVLNLSNNKIKDLETLDSLKELTSLKSLDLYRNDVTQLEDYRAKVFELLPGLTYLDGTDSNNKEMDESDLDEEDSAPVNGKADEDDDEDEGKAGNGEGNLEDSSLSADESSPNEVIDLDLGGTEEVESYESKSESEDLEEEEDEDEEDEEDVGLKDIYREDLEKESDGGDYEEESDEDIEDEEDELELDTSQPDESDIVDLDTSVEGAKRGLKRQHEDDSSDAHSNH